MEAYERHGRALIRRAVIWLSLQVKKALLKLSDDDFRDHELYELLREYGPASVLGRRVFDDSNGVAELRGILAA